MELTIDRAGRLVIPKRFRERFHLVSGSKLEIEADGEGIHLRPAGSGSDSLRRERGLLVHSGGGHAAGLDIAEFIRNQRDARSLEQGASTDMES